MTTNLKNITKFARDNNNSFSDYDNVDYFRNKLIFTKIKKNKNTIKNMEGGGVLDISNLASIANEFSEQTTKGLDVLQNVTNQATKTVNEVSDKTNQLVATGQQALDTATNIPGIKEGLDLLEAQQNKEGLDLLEAQQNKEDEKDEKDEEDEEESVIDDNSVVSEEDDEDEDEEENEVNNVESEEENEGEEGNNIESDQEYNDQSDTCVLQKGTILYYSTSKMSTMSKKNINFKESISKFVTSLDTSKMNIKMCTEEYSSATIHAFMVNIPISNIKITTGEKFEREDKELLNKKQLDKKYCNDRFRGLMFKHENEVSKIIPNQVKTGGGSLVLNPGDSLTVQASNNENQSCTYWLCDPSENLTYLWSTQCIGYNRLSKPLAYES